MTPNFAEAVDPVFDYVLRTLERIENGEEPDPDFTQQRILRALAWAEAKLGEADTEWNRAKYALVCWIDDMLVNAPWQGKQWWVHEILEQKLFNTATRAVTFFMWAKDATTSPRRDALEVYYLCVILGFQGIYAEAHKYPGGLEQLELPPDLYGWLTRTAEHLRKGNLSALPPPGPAADVAAPLRGRALMAQSLLLAAATFVVALLTVLWPRLISE